MEKNILNDLISKNLSLRRISQLTNTSLTTVRYWCKKYGLKSNHKTFKEQEKITELTCSHKKCPKCEKTLSIDNFYKIQNRGGRYCYCKSCARNIGLERVRNLKLKMIEYKGGECIRCGYKKYQGALEFHHLNPLEKDFNIAHLKRYTFNDVIKKELDKCVLVCSNCHREIHNELLNS